MGSMGREQESSVGGGGKSVAGRLLGTRLDSGLKVHARSVGETYWGRWFFNGL